MSNWLATNSLENDLVKLIPLEKHHKADLIKAASDGELWNYWYTSVPNEATIDAYLELAFQQKSMGVGFPFVIYHKGDEKIIGTTRFCTGDEKHRRVEIGYTWYAKSYQRTAVNTNCKYLLLRHAFEQLNCIAVEFKTNWFNYRSRNAILRIGAKQDGVIRSHRIDAHGNIRDTVIFSIIASEWKTVKFSLEYEMNKY